MTCKTRCLLAIEREQGKRGERIYFAASRGVLCASCEALARDTLARLGRPHACVTCGRYHGDECPKRSTRPPRPSSAPPPGQTETLDALDAYLTGLRAGSKRSPSASVRAPEVVRGFAPRARHPRRKKR